MKLAFGLLLLAGVSAASVQQPLLTPSTWDTDNDEYEFKFPIQRVAIIGAGPSALVAYRELTEVGFEVRLFERDRAPGGNWHYTEEAPADAPVPSAPIPVGDFVPSFAPPDVELPYSQEYEDDAEIRRDHRGPKPVWESLTSNAPSPLQQLIEWPWPVGTKWELSHYAFRNYARSYASYLNINSNDENPATAYNTRVELIEKRLNEDGEEQGWRLWLKSLTPTGNNTSRATWWTEDFDAVVVASGRYNAPVMPLIPGLADWVRRFPGLLGHSRQYRRPEAYTNQSVLIVGASVSGSEISRDINTSARKVYQSMRADNDSAAHYRLANYMRRIPKNTTFVGEISRFIPVNEGQSMQSSQIELKNGTIITGIDRIIFATGFRYSFPFLPQYYDDAFYTPHEGSSSSVQPFLPTDGSHIRDLHLDLFYIPDPTLAFLGMNLGTQSFSYSDYLCLALAKVWSNTAKLPHTRRMWEMYEERAEERGGLGKHFQFLGPARLTANIRFFMGWLNEAAVKYGGKQIDGLPKYTDEVNDYWLISHYGGPLEERRSDEEAVLESLGIRLPHLSDEASRQYDYNPMYDDNW
ncbi:hypothetical protein HYDPIDRAFT_112795 [Hydnomerulius pinastri MD-312]|uniref:FAD/NAD(P)-binding domain-containing protein n=1 Tax=Hydnomerulius pinastri MD-312 TaxID=994086 RepID=A0A0C9WEC4_9AGAM|nr:hypothetical protein HYDPIDRAFT_112795 [Hydnomerulius pinastri MD-312]